MHFVHVFSLEEVTHLQRTELCIVHKWGYTRETLRFPVPMHKRGVLVGSRGLLGGNCA